MTNATSTLPDAAPALNADAESHPAAHDLAPVLQKDWRFYTGLTALALALVLPLLAFAVPFLGLSTAVSAALVGGLIAGGPEVMFLLAAALLGKNVLHYYLSRLKQLFWKPAVVKPVSKPC